MKTCCQTGKWDSGVTLEKYSVPDVQSGWTTKKGMCLKPYVRLIAQEPATPSAGVPSSTVLQTPPSGGNSPVIHRAINMKGVTVVTTRAKKGCSVFTNKCTSIFLKAEECSHSLNYLFFSERIENHYYSLSHWLRSVCLVGDTKFQTSLLLILGTVRNARLGIQLVWALLKICHKKDTSVRNKMTLLALKALGWGFLKISKSQIYAMPLSAK